MEVFCRKPSAQHSNSFPKVSRLGESGVGGIWMQFCVNSLMIMGALVTYIIRRIKWHKWGDGTDFQDKSSAGLLLYYPCFVLSSNRKLFMWKRWAPTQLFAFLFYGIFANSKGLGEGFFVGPRESPCPFSPKGKGYSEMWSLDSSLGLQIILIKHHILKLLVVP